MKTKFVLTKYGPEMQIEWETGFEESVINQMFEEDEVVSISAVKYSNCIRLMNMPVELKKVVKEWYKNEGG